MGRQRWTGAAATLGVVLVAGCAAGGVGETSTRESSPQSSTEPSNSTSRSAGSESTASQITERLVDDARWVERDGVSALEVTPAERLRGEADAEVVEKAWRRVVKAVPDADSPGMHDQFVCHATFAPEKDAWYLEPARPAVGYWQTVGAGCNPGDVVDVG